MYSYVLTLFYPLMVMLHNYFERAPAEGVPRHFYETRSPRRPSEHRAGGLAKGSGKSGGSTRSRILR